MRILFFANHLAYGGGEKHKNWVAKQLSKAGNIVYYATANLNDDYLEQLRLLDLRDNVVPLKINTDLKKKNLFEYIRQLRNLYLKNGIERVVFFGGGLIEQLVARRYGIKVVLFETCNPRFRKPLSRLLKKIQYRFGDIYIFQTIEQSKCYCKKAQCKARVIPNPIMDTLPEPVLDNYRKEVVSVGRLSPEKNHKGLIKAFQLFHHNYPDYHLIIYGDGLLKKELLRLIDSLNLNNCISIVSGETNIVSLINGAELFVFNSLNEGMPNALIEALSMGLVCISTDCPIYGPRFLIEDGVNGFLVPVNNVEALCKKMETVIAKNGSLNEIRMNALKIRERLNPNLIAKMWVDAIED